MKDDYNDYVDVMLKTKPRRRPQPQQQQQEYDIQTYESSKSSDSDISSSVAAGAYVSKDMWSKLVLDDLNKRNVIYQLSKTALELCEKSTHPNLTWKPDKATAEILNKYGSMESSSLSGALRSVDDNTGLPEDTILVWTAKFNSDTNAYGVDLPIIRTRGIVNGMSPQKITSLLMDSSKIKLYNKISLGRTDQEVYQEGINVVDQYGDKYGHGESKIVFNLTKPPIVKKQMVFRTLMHARRLNPYKYYDETGQGIEGEKECGGEDGYIMVSRAVPGEDNNNNEGQDNDSLRSEILMGANLLRCIPDKNDSTDLTCVTHVMSPLVHPMIAGKVGMKGAIDFFNDIREIAGEKTAVSTSD
eukprot:CAMPEP_0178974676 /NCGR_PEP_ID=MMETSP0789-20121207/22630_1 /TAXON_ID=3005 /ORGANISM="Rhizosolenia setigera, Strain CCMP 1694" /LENGTH=357 /DNA_ID=CAMNT_0020663119 /DNA_START=169 /DNA_END=1242 /DNA_ORIENTATION=+